MLEVKLGDDILVFLNFNREKKSFFDFFLYSFLKLFWIIQSYHKIRQNSCPSTVHLTFSYFNQIQKEYHFKNQTNPDIHENKANVLSHVTSDCLSLMVYVFHSTKNPSFSFSFLFLPFSFFYVTKFHFNFFS